MTEIIIKLPGTDLASRKAAAVERHKLAHQVASGNILVIDLSEVISISDSYADELFGVLAAANGLEWLVKNVRFRGASEAVLRSIAVVVTRRLKETGQPVALSA